MSLWVDKYRPTSLARLDYHKDQAAHLKKLVLKPLADLRHISLLNKQFDKGGDHRPPHFYFLRYKHNFITVSAIIVQELCESRGGRPELSVLTSLLASVDVKIY